MKNIFAILFLTLTFFQITTSQSLDTAALESWHRFQRFSVDHEILNGSLPSWGETCLALHLDDDYSALRGIDHSQPTAGKTRVLFLASLSGLFLMLDRWIFQFYVALARHPQYDVILWGAGMPGFNVNETTSQNMERWFQNPSFDVVYSTWIYHRLEVGYEDIRGANIRNHSLSRSLEFDVLPGNPLVITTTHELTMKDEDMVIRPNIIFTVNEQFLGSSKTLDVCGSLHDSTQANGPQSRTVCPINDFFAKLMLVSPYSMPAFMPDGIDFTLYNDTLPQTVNYMNESHKKYQVLLVGSTNAKLYKLRAAAQTAVKYTSVLRQVKHPGYIMDWDEAKTKACEHHIKTRERYIGYAASMMEARVCLIGTGVQPLDNCKAVAWTLRKYYEAVAAGCVIIGDVPANINMARHVSLRLTGEDSVAISFTVERFIEDYYNRTSYYSALKKRGREFVLKEYSYETLINKYFTPAIIAYKQKMLLLGLQNNYRSLPQGPSSSNRLKDEPSLHGGKHKRAGGKGASSARIGVFGDTMSDIVVRNDGCYLNHGDTTLTAHTHFWPNATGALHSAIDKITGFKIEEN